MKELILRIIESIVRGLFRKSPEERKEAREEKTQRQHQKETDIWRKEEHRLEADCEKARQTYNAYIAGHHLGNGPAGQLDRLHEQWRLAAQALGNHRRKQPPSHAGGA